MLYEAHCVVAALSDNDSAGKGLVVDLDAERPVSAIKSVLLDKVEVIYTGDLAKRKSTNTCNMTQNCHNSSHSPT